MTKSGGNESTSLPDLSKAFRTTKNFRKTKILRNNKCLKKSKVGTFDLQNLICSLFVLVLGLLARFFLILSGRCFLMNPYAKTCSFLDVCGLCFLMSPYANTHTFCNCTWLMFPYKSLCRNIKNIKIEPSNPAKA